MVPRARVVGPDAGVGQRCGVDRASAERGQDDLEPVSPPGHLVERRAVGGQRVDEHRVELRCRAAAGRPRARAGASGPLASSRQSSAAAGRERLAAVGERVGEVRVLGRPWPCRAAGGRAVRAGPAPGCSPSRSPRPAGCRVGRSRPNSTSVAKLTYVVWYGCIVTWSMVGSTSAATGDQHHEPPADKPAPLEPPRHPVRRQHGQRRDREQQLPQPVVEVGAEHDRDDRQRERLDADQRDAAPRAPAARACCRSRCTAATTAPVSAKTRSRVGISSARWRGT